MYLLSWKFKVYFCCSLLTLFTSYVIWNSFHANPVLRWVFERLVSCVFVISGFIEFWIMIDLISRHRYLANWSQIMSQKIKGKLHLLVYEDPLRKKGPKIMLELFKNNFWALSPFSIPTSNLISFVQFICLLASLYHLATTI